MRRGRVFFWTRDLRTPFEARHDEERDECKEVFVTLAGDEKKCLHQISAGSIIVDEKAQALAQTILSVWQGHRSAGLHSEVDARRNPPSPSSTWEDKDQNKGRLSGNHGRRPGRRFDY